MVECECEGEGGGGGRDGGEWECECECEFARVCVCDMVWAWVWMWACVYRPSMCRHTAMRLWAFAAACSAAAMTCGFHLCARTCSRGRAYVICAHGCVCAHVRAHVGVCVGVLLQERRVMICGFHISARTRPCVLCAWWARARVHGATAVLSREHYCTYHPSASPPDSAGFAATAVRVMHCS